MMLMPRIKLLDRVGTIGFNSNGSKMIIDEYMDTDNIWVKFIESGNRIHTTWYAFRNGNVRNPYDKIIFNIGYMGEGKYKSVVNGKTTSHYKVWRGMLQRCYDKGYHQKRPTYIGCSVIEKWHNFQIFAAWYDQNYYEVNEQRMELDKDILIKGNKIYSPDTCIFVPKNINTLFTKCDSKRGKHPIGVCFRKDSKQNPYLARCCNNKGNRIYIDYFSTAEEAFQAYKTHKEKYIVQVAEEHKDKIPEKLYNALMKYQVEITD
jgi:hypothetical protein